MHGILFQKNHKFLQQCLSWNCINCNFYYCKLKREIFLLIFNYSYNLMKVKWLFFAPIQNFEMHKHVTIEYYMNILTR